MCKRLLSFFAKIMPLAITIMLLQHETRAQYCSVSIPYACKYYYGLSISSFATTGAQTNITNNNSGCSSGGYKFFNTMTLGVVQGSTANYSLRVAVPYYYYNCQFAIYADLNIDGDFTDAGETLASGSMTTGTAKTGSFAIPSTATLGTSRLRVRIDPYNTVTPCGKGYYGEIEDYVLQIIPSCTTKFSAPIDPYSYACANGDGSITVNAANGDKYQWQVMTAGSFTDLSNGGMYSDVTEKTLKLHNVPANMAGTKYRCIVTPTCGANVRSESDTVTLNIRPDVKLLSQTTNDTSCIGLSTILSYKASDEITQSQWEINTGNGYVPITGPQFVQTDDSLIVTNIPDTLNGALIRCTFNGVCGTVTTKDMHMAVNPVPTVITHPRDTLVKPNSHTTFKVEASGIGVQYQWQVGVNGSFVNINNSSIYTGVKTNMLLVKGISFAQNNFQFRCLVRGSGSCKSTPDTSNFAVLSVEPPASVKDIITENSITLYPNPAKGDEVVISTESFVATYLGTYSVTDKTGKTISVGNMSVDGKPTTVNISKLPSDIYFVQVMDKDNVIVKSLKFTKL